MSATCLKVIAAAELQLPESVSLWLSQLDSATVIEVPGRQADRWRVVSGLVHGNEPSGLLAIYRFLHSGIQPETNLALVVASVRAARHEPMFSHRVMPGEYDLNRRFGVPYSPDLVTELAAQISAYIRDRQPECVIDLHNTSGRGPSFAVSVSEKPELKNLAALFTDTVIVTRLVVGSLMEQDFGCPVLTIECGGADDDLSHQVAYNGLLSIAQLAHLSTLVPSELAVHRHPLRVRVRAGVSLGYGKDCVADVDITLTEDIERFNFGATPAGDCLGWLARPLGDCLEAIDEQGHDRIDTLFELRGQSLLAAREMKLFMATPRADIAMSDCLFYVLA